MTRKKVETSASISRRMATVRRAGTHPERMLMRALDDAGIAYAPSGRGLPGTPDILVPRQRLALFVHGCFWHLHGCPKGQTQPRRNALFWEKKRNDTVARDQRKAAELRALGWRVATAWECELRDDERAKQWVIEHLLAPVATR